MLNDATKANLRRKSAYVDQVQTHAGAPLFSWLDLSLTELCNRTCVFCPRADPELYPNQPLHMPIGLVGKIAKELRAVRYRGTIVLCGYGEPLLHPEIARIVSILGLDSRVEIVTNGDRLDVETIRALSKAGADYFVVSMYDGPHQVRLFEERFRSAGVPDESYLLRDRWHSEEDGFGLKLTNRAGTIDVGRQDPVDVNHACHYLAYQMTVDWNGDVMLCAQDWNKRVRFGNLNRQSLVEVWHSAALHKRRMKLIAGKRCDAPCSGCNTDGTLHGFNHVERWKKA